LEFDDLSEDFLIFFLTFYAKIGDMNGGRLVVDELLANWVRSGRKQPWWVLHGSR